MADDAQTQTAATTPSASLSISMKVAERISTAGTTILTKVVDSLANVEIEKRADALLKAVNLAVATQRELNKAKPDVVSYNDDGSVKDASWTKPKLEEKKKLVEKLAKIEAAVAKAIEKNDFSGVLSLSGE